jgi:hypothetical protein
MANVTDLINYYANLLIIQYNGLPKAKATIELIAQTIISDGLITDIQNAYNIDTAVGKQLDVVGKYQNIDRYFFEIDLVNYFALVPYSDYLSLPDSPPAFGCSTYANFNDFSYNGTLTYNQVITSTNALSDDIFRVLIRLAILKNNSNYSRQSIDAIFWEFFGDELRPESNGNMSIQYFVNTDTVTTLVQAVIAKHLLMAPMGVLIQVIDYITGLMFATVTYDGAESPFGYGFSTYADYASLSGQVLTYSQISEG